MLENLLNTDDLNFLSYLDSLGDFALFSTAIPAIVIYFLVTLPFFLVFWVWYKKEFQSRRIQQKQRSNEKQWWKEIRQSILSVLIFTLIDVGVYIAEQHGLTSIYHNVDQYGIPYLLFSVVLMILFQDTFFYWAHRLMHWKPLYKFTHKVHHDSIDVSPFTAYSFHPVETIVEGLPSAIFSFLLPVHFSALIGYQVVSLVLNVVGHLGYEIIPQSWTTHWLLKWKTPSTHHNMHHSHVNGNYTLYFRFWDVWMGTEFKEYPATLQAVYDRMNQHQPEAIASKESVKIGNA